MAWRKVAPPRARQAPPYQGTMRSWRRRTGSIGMRIPWPARTLEWRRILTSWADQGVPFSGLCGGKHGADPQPCNRARCERRRLVATCWYCSRRRLDSDGRLTRRSVPPAAEVGRTAVMRSAFCADDRACVENDDLYQGNRGYLGLPRWATRLLAGQCRSYLRFVAAGGRSPDKQLGGS